MSRKWNRRQFLAGSTAVAGVAADAQAQPPGRPIRVGFIGVGGRGTSLLRVTLTMPGIEVPAVCDINEANLSRAQSLVEQSGRPRPEGYSSGIEDFRRLVARDDLDAVVNAGPWEWHTPMSVATMEAGKYAATEVPAATTLEECWSLVRASEASGKPCMILENVCYFRNALMVLNLVQQGVLGDLAHCEGGYQHDVRVAFFGRKERGEVPGEVSWRGMHAVRTNGNIYPTHPIGPIAWWLDINRGDRFTYLTSMSSRSRGINHFVTKRFGKEHRNASRRYALGDVNTSMIMTEKGRTVTLYHDTSLPRPYDLILRVQGTNGIYSGTLDKLYVEGRSPEHEKWEDPERYYAQYEHAIWKALGERARGRGHGGADYLTLHQFYEAVRQNRQTPIDVYDTAAWSAIMPLSAQSVAARSAPIDFPDFTQGRWKRARPIEFLGI
ncbi:MAG: Gfo/Idh/MocA family oxidoreductase [Bryobacterales bacterium]|nr:Gfo/Idh/MocA family oxidoreductase [Bryobacterales bacterium]